MFLRAAGVRFMQGYRFGKAVTTGEITAHLQSKRVLQARRCARRIGELS